MGTHELLVTGGGYSVSGVPSQARLSLLQPEKNHPDSASSEGSKTLGVPNPAVNGSVKQILVLIVQVNSLDEVQRVSATGISPVKVSTV